MTLVVNEKFILDKTGLLILNEPLRQSVPLRITPLCPQRKGFESGEEHLAILEKDRTGLTVDFTKTNVASWQRCKPRPATAH